MAPSCVEQRFLGGWRLVSLTVLGPNERSEPHGPDPIGTILYTPDHRFAAILARRDLPPVDSPEGASLQSSLALVRNSVAYFGEWKLDEPNHIVIHRAEWASWGRLLAADQIRHYRFDDDQLILRTPVEADVARYGKVVFARA